MVFENRWNTGFPRTSGFLSASRVGAMIQIVAMSCAKSFMGRRVAASTRLTIGPARRRRTSTSRPDRSTSRYSDCAPSRRTASLVESVKSRSQAAAKFQKKLTIRTSRTAPSFVTRGLLPGIKGELPLNRTRTSPSRKSGSKWSLSNCRTLGPNCDPRATVIQNGFGLPPSSPSSSVR